jgi:hypothetical protein
VPLLKKLRLEGRDEEQLGFLAIAAEDCPTHHEHEGRSEPLFLVYRNGALKAKVQGANLPQLLAAIGEWTTPLPGLDDPEVCGLTRCSRGVVLLMSRLLDMCCYRAEPGCLCFPAAQDNPFHLQLSKGAAAGSSKDKPKVVAKKK